MKTMAIKTISIFLVLNLPSVLGSYYGEPFYYGTFPDGFIWSSATSSYQIEGGWNADGKGESIWDTFVRIPDRIENGATGDDACKSYEKYMEDVHLLKNMGVTHYRFSIAWARILPDGLGDTPNAEGVQYYHNLIDALLVNGIQPMVTLYHWDLPQALEDLGGWLNEDMIVNAFANYARILYAEYGSKVKYWITINEPWIIATQGYGWGNKAPGIYDSNGTLAYKSGHNVIKAHAAAYHVYYDEFKEQQNGLVGLSFNSGWSEPRDPDNPEDLEASERAMQFDLGWFAHPIYKGDYPSLMKERIAEKSELQGFSESRLPQFTPDEIQYINGTSDFFGLNYYSGGMVFTDLKDLEPPNFDADKDIGGEGDPHGLSSGSFWLTVTPWTIRSILNWIKDEYNNPPVLITENGMSDRNGSLEDDHRVYYYKHYINFMLQAIDLDDCNVIGYTAWSLLDNFEWEMGYVERFGMHYIDFDDPERQRTPKASAIYYTQIIADNGFPEPPTPTTTPSSPTSGSDEILSTTFTLFALLASGIFM